MATISEIPLSGENQTFPITLNGTAYRLTFTYRDADEAGWIMAIADTDGTTILSGVPLVTGCDLLAPYAHLGLGGAMLVVSDGEPDAVPTFDGLGSTSHLYWITA